MTDAIKHNAPNPVHRKGTKTNVPVFEGTLATVPTDAWRLLGVALRVELRLFFQADAIRILCILPSGTRRNFTYRYATNFSAVRSNILEFAGFKKA